MRKVGKSALLVAVAGVIAPFVLGFGVSLLFVKEIPAGLVSRLPADFNLFNIHIFIGATLCATSVGITARVFKDLGKLQTKEAKIILGAAVIDDVLGLIILAAVAGIVGAAMTGQEFSIGSIAKITFIALGFLVAAIVLGTLLVPRIIRFLWKLRTQGIMVISALIFCFLLSWLSDAAGLATIVGAFAAGLILEEVHFKGFKEDVTLHQLIRPISTIFVPIFFVLMGIRVRLEAFSNFGILGLALGVTLAAIIGKQLCSLTTGQRGVDKLSIGVGMIPRGEVGLIFAGIGRGVGVFDDSLFSAMVIMVIITTLVTPPILKLTLARWEKKTGRVEDS
jgi:Kef-type K+ transport system membrane component KefB